MEEYDLDKWIWTESDFKLMGWHDATIYGFRLDDNLEFDIDYIFQWNKPEIEGMAFTFWVAPCTLIFNKPSNLSFELTQSFDDKWLEIQDIEMTESEGKKNWNIITQQGDISFNSDSFTQIVRHNPSFQFGQSISSVERGGFSFGRTTGEPVDNVLKPEIKERRQRDVEHYELAKKHFLVQKEYGKLLEAREKGEVETKVFLIKKKELNEAIEAYSRALRNTRFEPIKL